MLKDMDIRTALVKKLIKENEGHPYRLINELTVCDGDARVDIAVANGRLCGYEIKSDMDTLERLQNQINAYNRTFDKMIIVVGDKYKEKVLDEIPDWWGVQLAYRNRYNNISFKSIRTAKINAYVDAKAVLELLWRDELVNLLKDRGIKGLSNKHRRKLRDIAKSTIPLKDIKNYTREILKVREGWRAD